jgi:DNA polymerase III epsilon subunit-like protein
LDDIIEIAAVFLDNDGIPLEDGSFSALVKPTKRVSTLITTLTGITQSMVADADDFGIVGRSFIDTTPKIGGKAFLVQKLRSKSRRNRTQPKLEDEDT